MKIDSFKILEATTTSEADWRPTQPSLQTLMELFVCDEGLCDELVVEWMIELETDWN